MKDYGSNDIVRLTGDTRWELTYWCRRMIVSADVAETHGTGSYRRFSFRDVVEVAVAVALRRLGVGVNQIGYALMALRDDDEPLPPRMRASASAMRSRVANLPAAKRRRLRRLFAKEIQESERVARERRQMVIGALVAGYAEHGITKSPDDAAAELAADDAKRDRRWQDFKNPRTRGGDCFYLFVPVGDGIPVCLSGDELAPEFLGRAGIIVNLEAILSDLEAKTDDYWSLTVSDGAGA
jgi:DNA-binding transcriptional MerR regulator